MKYSEEEILDKLRKMLFTTQQANECGLSNNDFKEDIETLSGAIGLIKKQEKIIDMLIEEIKYGAQMYCHRINDCEVVGGNRTCEECIKEYFKKEVEKC